ncbi:hypothetical protein VOLCADRAFT_91388 [Volvox carteri f. nagariensis]|uniref:Uncharacterized protein n=1 Tax=Volvox carteri f. nagariensis TaxID=3068 RepID=D8TWY0_VOLCA|nr:uncharacterized protein VOLCADRAFT_91388 [Volvox carteri f. nagariensis]EFJ48124.1 hypothetical protein VOLCADRAFT_91388 [Volvox carteri f. nagariensis]|eukprot:XP_002950809.1 hypothetical protein VOLCADRAFT_91388 [Volvox carteri f. nagariensis]
MVAGKRSRPGSAPAAGSAPDEVAGPGPGSTASGIVALHRSRMFDWKPSAVVAIAPCPGAPLFAVGYESGSLELWDMLQLVCIQTVVGPPLELTSLAWARDSVSSSTPWRTFAAFLDGTVAEVVWRQGAVAHSMDSYGGVVWALAASPASVVKPGSTGNIHILDAVTGREHLRITAAAVTSRPVTVWRLLSLSDGTLVSGDSDGAVQMWDGRFGTLLHRFTQHRADVLALAAMDDGTAVFAAGVDSQVAMFTRVGGVVHGGGRTSQPESWVYTHYKRPHTHDVRALALLALPDGDGGRGAVLLSGGVDAQLIAYPARTFLQEHPHRLCKCPQRPICQASAASAVGVKGAATPPPSRLIVAQHDLLDVWQLAAAAAPTAAAAEAFEGTPLELLAAPRHLARVRVKGTRIAAASLSPSGAFVAFTTPAGTRVCRLEAGAAGAGGGAAAVPPTLTRLKLAAAAAAPAVAIALTDTHLALAFRDGGLMSYNLSEGTVTARRSHVAPSPAAAAVLGAPSSPAPQPQEQQQQQQAWRSYCPAAAQLVTSPDGSSLAAIGGQGISLYRMPGLEPYGRMLRADGAFTAAAFSRDGRLLAATTSTCQLLVWEASSGGGGGGGTGGSDCNQLRWCLDNAEAISAAISRLPGAPTSVSFCPAPSRPGGGGGGDGAVPYRLVVNSPGGMVHFDLSRRVAETYVDKRKDDGAAADGSSRHRRRRGYLRPDQLPQPEDRPESRGGNGRVIRTVHPAVWVGHVGPEELLLLEKPWEEVLAALPPPLLTHRYGS